MKFTFTLATSWRGWQRKYFFMEKLELWANVPMEWALETLVADVEDLYKLLTGDFKTQFDEFDGRSRQVAGRTNLSFTRATYPFLIQWIS